MRVSVLLTRHELDALGRLATVERRPPRDQAGYLIAEGLRQRGLLPNEPQTTEATTERAATRGASECGRSGAETTCRHLEPLASSGAPPVSAPRRPAPGNDPAAEGGS